MVFLRTECTSLTGKVLYSDCFRQHVGQLGGPDKNTLPYQKPFLNRWASIPVIGSLAGITRMILAIIHIIGHLISAAIFRDRGHLFHAVKGCAEFLRGFFEAIPIAGNIFVWLHDPHDGLCHECYNFNDEYFRGVVTHYSFFIIKITNLSAPDHIDRHNCDTPNGAQHTCNAYDP